MEMAPENKSRPFLIPEKQIENYALSFLRRGRKEWDEPHTKAVVYYATEIATSNNLDVLVLKTAAWFHDIGYYSLFKENESKQLGHVMDKKVMHMANGERLTRTFFQKSWIETFYTNEQILRIIHLVSVHDYIDKLRDDDEIALMEADTLGAIDIERVTTTFNKDDAMKYVEKELVGRRFPKFKTEFGIRRYQELLLKFIAQFEHENKALTL